MISVIVPIYKVEPYLRQCINSILSQTYENLDILLIDDGSPDKCGEICEEYARIDHRIRVFHTDNKGLSAARNLGLQEAKGEYIGFVDSDDWLEPEMYEILLRRLEESGTSISAGAVWSEYKDRKEIYSISDSIYSGTEAIHALICSLSNGVWNKLYKKGCWTDIRFPDNHLYEEIATLYKVILKANSLSCVPKPLYHYRMREGSIVHTKSKESIKDYWNAFYGRYSHLSTLPDFKEDQVFLECLEKQIAFIAVMTWSLMYRIPREERDYDFLHMISSFVRNRVSFFNKKNWKLSLRVGVFFSQYTNDSLFSVLYIAIRIRRLLYCLANNTSRTKSLFP